MSRGQNIPRAVCVLGFVLASGSLSGRADARENDQLFQRRPDRLLIESSQRVSDGRKLQRDADTSFRRAEGSADKGAEGTGTREAADRGKDGPTRTAVLAEESVAGAESPR